MTAIIYFDFSFPARFGVIGDSIFDVGRRHEQADSHLVINASTASLFHKRSTNAAIHRPHHSLLLLLPCTSSEVLLYHLIVSNFRSPHFCHPVLGAQGAAPFKTKTGIVRFFCQLTFRYGCSILYLGAQRAAACTIFDSRNFGRQLNRQLSCDFSRHGSEGLLPRRLSSNKSLCSLFADTVASIVKGS